MKKTATTTAKIRRVTATTIAVGAIGSAAMAASMGATLSGFTASITNSTNTASTAALAVQETGGNNVTCNTYDATSTCGTINKYGGTATPLVPGGSQTTTVTFKNTGSVAVGSSNLTPGTCVATSTGVTGATTPSSDITAANNLCSVLKVDVYKAATATGTPIYTGTVGGFSSAKDLGTLAVNATQAYTFVVSLPASATTAIQGQQVSQPLTWNFAQ